MKNLLISALIISNVSSFAIGGSLIKNLAKPFAKIGIGSKAEKVVSKSKHIKSFLKTSDILKSDLDEVKIFSVLPDLNGTVLESNYEKISELQLLGSNLKETLQDLIVGSKGATSNDVTLLVREIEDFNFLLSAVTVTVAKDFNRSDALDVIGVIQDVVKLSNFKASGSYRIISALEDLESVLVKSARDIARGSK